LAVAVRRDRTHTVADETSFLRTNGVNTGKGVFTTWHAEGHGQLADCVAWLVHEYRQSAGQTTRAARPVRVARGPRPSTKRRHARNTAAPASAAHLQRGIDICEQALLTGAAQP
jgi:hypothetical protein